ncbi:MAG: TIGR03086 family metal-binding protein [Chloroflexi bacterium]|nr:TIGR03086 family metal-binding protein [Chloroflexota bacterium]
MKSTRTDAKNLYVRATASSKRLIEGIKPDQWQNATPCAEWDLRALVNHVTGENMWIEQFFTGRTMEDVGDSLNGDILGDDPIAAYTGSLARALPLITEGTMESTYRFSFAEMAGRGYVTQLFADQFVHAWDIAKGSNQPFDADEELIGASTPVFEEMVALAGQGSVYGYQQKVESGASPLSVLLGVVGRREDWQPPAGAISR